MREGRRDGEREKREKQEGERDKGVKLMRPEREVGEGSGTSFQNVPRAPPPPTPAACRQRLTKRPLMRSLPGLFWGRNGGKGANPHSLKGVAFCKVRWRGLGPGSGGSRQEVDAGTKARHLPKAEHLESTSRLTPSLFPCGPAGRGKLLGSAWVLPSTAASGPHRCCIPS